MSRNALNAVKGRQIFRRMLQRPANLPFTFVYDGVFYQGLEAFNARRSTTEEKNGTRTVTTARVDSQLKITVNAFLNAEFGETEYTVYFENTGKKPTKVLKDVYALDCVFEGDHPLLRGNLGDHDHFYAAYEHDLTRSDRYFESTGGRATHIVFPYFDLAHGAGGTLLALGWAGTWNALFTDTGRGTRVRAKTDITLDTVLLPGETVRTGLIALLPYKGRDADNATNLWREWFIKYNMPKANAQGDAIQPFTTTCWASDTGRPNSDGSISECAESWKPTLDKLVKEKVVPDFRWFDAGWYYDPAGKTVETDWWGTVGTWELDREKWPGDSFRQSNEACHAQGMKVLTWFEPERVTHVPDLVKNYGYKEEWSIGSGDSRTNNIGNEECLAWTLDRITRFLDEHAVDLYREDNNSDPGFAWPFTDRQEAERLGLPRGGITENKCIVGHYRLWDGIIDFCARHGKCTYVDSCASGGGRNDLESMRRGIPFMRSDYDRTTSSMRLSQSATFPKWVPFHGSNTKETETQLEASKGAGSNAYVSRASWLPVYNYGEEFTHNPELDYDLMRRNIAEWRASSHLLTKDFYVLTPWHHELTRTSWTAFAYDDAEAGESLLLCFRMEEAPDESFTAKLKFAKIDSKYELRNADTGETVTLPGLLLRKGFTVRLPQPKSSALYYIRKI